MLNDDESTPPISPFGAQRAIARELAGVKRALETLSKDVLRMRSMVAFLTLILGLFMLYLASR